MCSLPNPVRARCGALPPKADSADFQGRFREIISDPINLLIKRDPYAGFVSDGFVRLHNGNDVSITGPGAYYGDFSQILVLNRGVHEPLEEYVFQELIASLPLNPYMLELGSYWAHYSMWLLRERPTATVVMVEPDPDNMAAGQANFIKNGLSGEFINDMVGSGRFDVDRFRRARNLDKIDLLHADIQGAEAIMLEGCRDALQERAIDRLFISTHSQDLHEAVIHCLDRHGYVVEVSSDFDNHTMSFDGLVVASSQLVDPLLPGFQPLGRNGMMNMSTDAVLARLVEHQRNRSQHFIKDTGSINKYRPTLAFQLNVRGKSLRNGRERFLVS